MRNSIGTIREFKTAHFRVVVDAIHEDSPDTSWDETGETDEKIESGEWSIFCVRARVFHDSLGEIAADYLGNCIYASLDEFQDHRRCGAQNKQLAAAGHEGRCGSYFAEMIREVCREARKTIDGARAIRVRS